MFEVLDVALQDREWLADDFSIADIANWCWVRTYRWSGVSRDGLENLDRWLNQMSERRACRHGVDVPEPRPIEELKGEDVKKFVDRAQSMLQT